MIENIVVKSSDWRDSDLETLFEDEEVHFTECDEMSALMREIGVFSSANQARQAGRQGPIPKGFTDNYKASKKRRIWIWNPWED